MRQLPTHVLSTEQGGNAKQTYISQLPLVDNRTGKGPMYEDVRQLLGEHDKYYNDAHFANIIDHLLGRPKISQEQSKGDISTNPFISAREPAFSPRSSRH